MANLPGLVRVRFEGPRIEAMAAPDQIPTDLTLEIGVGTSPEKFLAITRAFFGYVEDIVDGLSPNERINWTVLVKEGSALIAVEPPTGARPELVESVYAKAEFGIDQLAQGRLEESHLSESALKHLRALSGLTEQNDGVPIPIRVWVRRKPLELTAEIARTIEDDWRVDYHDYGTIEGRLETIQDRDGRLQLRVRDAALRQSVKCYVSDNMLNDAFSTFRKRVEITGTVHYRRDGTPISIDVVHIETLPDDSELPTADDVRGLLKAGNGSRADLLG